MERDYWLASSLIGTAVGTIFEGRSWVEELMNCVNSEEVRNLLSNTWMGDLISGMALFLNLGKQPGRKNMVCCPCSEEVVT